MRKSGVARVFVWAGLVVLGAVGCSQELDDPSLSGTIPFKPNRPTVPGTTTAAPYAGANASVREAQERLGTGLDLHARVIFRTCSPTGGVCHNAKEYPDLHTPANFIAAIDAPCNVQSGTWQGVYDRCERVGDRFRLGEGMGGDREIGYLVYLPGEFKPAANTSPGATTPGLHIYLADPLSAAKSDVNATGRFIRSFVNRSGLVEQLPFASFDARWWVLDGGKHVFAQVDAGRTTRVQDLLAVGIVQGDQNRNGVLGARANPPVPLLRPGHPEESYLIGRLRGRMFGGEIPGSRMPLANQPLSVPEMLALFCFVETLPPDRASVNLASPIDYAGCSYAAAPESLNLLGSGVTWVGRIKNILEFNCGGCHGGTEPQAGLDLKGGGVYARVLAMSSQRSELALIKARAPAESYLWLKISGDKSIRGARMPFNPLTGQGQLTDAELADIKAWIDAGAVENQ